MGWRGPGRHRCFRRALATALGLAAMLPACAGSGELVHRDQGFARLAVPARIDAPPPAEEIVSRFDERIDVRVPPTGAPPRLATLATTGLSHAGLRRVRDAAVTVADDAAEHVARLTRGAGPLPFDRTLPLADRQLDLVRLAPWRAGVELYTDRGLCFLMGSQALVDESDRDPVTIERRGSAFEGDDLAILGLRLRY